MDEALEPPDADADARLGQPLRCELVERQRLIFVRELEDALEHLAKRRELEEQLDRLG